MAFANLPGARAWMVHVLGFCRSHVLLPIVSFVFAFESLVPTSSTTVARASG